MASNQESRTGVLEHIKQLLINIGTNGNGDIIVDSGVELFDTLYFEQGRKIFLHSTKTLERKLLSGSGEEELYKVFYLLVANSKALVSREFLVEKKTGSNWETEPREILQGKDTVGLMGVSIVEEIAGKRLLAPVFCSPDGSFATLTMFTEGDAEELSCALADIEAIRDALGVLSRDLSEKNKELLKEQNEKDT